MASISLVRISRMVWLRGFCLLVLPAVAQAQDTAAADAEPARATASGDLSLPPTSEREIRPCSLLMDSTAGNHALNLWSFGIVPYEFRSNVTWENEQLALAAMAEIEAVAFVNFVPRQGEANYVSIQDFSANNSFVGMIGGKQDVNIFNWNVRFIMIHEFMHALGAKHEQQRPDRDDYITIEWANIKSGFASQFTIPSGENVYNCVRELGAYDFDSVMHYFACAFSKCTTCAAGDANCRTMTAQPSYYAQWQNAMGQQDHFSDGDMYLLATLYPNPGHETSVIIESAPFFVSDPQPGQISGWSVAIFNNFAVVGAPAFDPLSDIDAAYIFETTAPQQRLKLTASDLQEGARFGNSVGISGRRAIVGASPHGWFGYGPGAAYVFDTYNGQQLFKLISSNPDTTSLFGHAVAIDYERAIVGSPWGGSDDSFPFDDWGAAYVFDPGSGQQLSKLLPSDTAEKFVHFGFSVDISGNTAIVGSPFDDHAGYASGSAYLFNADTGQQLFKLIATDAHSIQSFGNSVAIVDNIAVVGAAGDNHAGSNSGAAYLFNATTGQQLRRLTASDAHAGQQFGRSVAINGNTAIVGTSGNSPDPGAAYLFNVSTGAEIHKLEVCDASGGDGIGTSVAINGYAAILGAPYGDDAGSNAGAAFVFDYPAGAWSDSATPGDVNGDEIVDLRDIADFINCFTGAGGGPVPGECAAADFNDNDDVALDDFDVLRAFLVGP